MAAQTRTLPTIKATEQTAHWRLWRSHGTHSQDLCNFLTGWIAENSRGERGGKWNIKAYLEGDRGTEGLGLNQGRSAQQQRESANSCLSDRWKEGRREGERVRQWTTRRDKADKKRSPDPKTPLGPLAHPFLSLSSLSSIIPSPACSSRSSLSLLYHFFDLPSYPLCFLSALSPALLFFLSTFGSPFEYIYMHGRNQEKCGCAGSCAIGVCTHTRYISNQISPLSISLFQSDGLFWKGTFHWFYKLSLDQFTCHQTVFF